MCAQGDSTWFIERCLARSLSGVALSSICDPQAAALCHAAGEGAELQLRFGGKTAPEADSGPPIDALVKVSTPTTQCPLAVAAMHVAARTCWTWTVALGLSDCDHACAGRLADCLTLWRAGLASRW